MTGRLASGGFRWLKSRKDLERRGWRPAEDDLGPPGEVEPVRGPVELKIGILNMQDADLRAWRRANPVRTGVRGDVQDDWVCRSDMYRLRSRSIPEFSPDTNLFDARAVLTRNQNRVARLNELCDRIVETAVPWFASTIDPRPSSRQHRRPDLVLQRLGPGRAGGQPGQARALVDRFVALGPEQRDAFERRRNLANCGERPRWHDPAAVGWSSVVPGLE
jgi:hypothetical protein